MTREVRHKFDSGHALFNYPEIEVYSDCEERIICLSERSFQIILKAIEYIDQMRTRVYTDRVQDFYTLVDDSQWDSFQQFVSDLKNQLGGYLVCNEILSDILIQVTRLADSAESIDSKTSDMVGCSEIVDDLAAFLGASHPLTEIMGYFCEHFPTIAPRIDWTPIIKELFTGESVSLPLLAELAAMNASLGLIAAAQVGEAPLSAARTLLAAFSAVDDMWGRIHDYIVGDLSWFDVIRAIWNFFLPDEDGGEGGDDPDNNPELRTTVNVAVNIPVTVDATCAPVINIEGGSSGGCCAVGGDAPITSIPTIPPPTIPTGEDFPPVFEDRPAYDEYRCKAIQYAIYHLGHSLINLGGLSGFVGVLTVAVVAGLLLTPLAPIALLVLISSLGFLLGIDITLLTFFATVGGELITDLDEYICDLYNAETSGEAQGVINDKMSDLVAALGLDTLPAFYFASVCQNLASYELLSMVYTPTELDKATVEAWENPLDLTCDSCAGETVDYTVLQGSEIGSHPSNPFSIETDLDSEDPCFGDGRGITVSFPVPVTITVVTISGSTACGVCTGNIYRYFDNEALTSVLLLTDAKPQDSSPVSGVQGLYFLVDCDGDTPTFNVTYTVD